MSIPLLDLNREYQYMKEAIDGALAQALSHQQWILGPEVKELEAKVTDYLGVNNAVGVASGTDALVLSLRALAIQRKGIEYFEKSDEILTPAFTFTATGTSILRSGATPVFLDINLDNYCLDTEQVERYLGQHGEKVVGIVPVHLYGYPTNMDAIMECARKYNLFVVEDCAQSFGARWDGKQSGSLGDCGAFSFFPTKNLGGFGDGGMIATNNPILYDIIQMLRKHGGKDKYNVEHLGYNSRLDTMQAALLLAKMKYVDEMNEKRRRIAKYYQSHLSDCSKILLPKESEKAYHVYNQFTIRTQNRDTFKKMLSDKGVQTMIYYSIPLSQMKVFEGKCRIPYPLEATEQATQQVLSLPIEPLLTDEELSVVVEAVKTVASEVSP
ncbi:DegT/DnrJ/EryC1/StrS family aminotransferase [Atribacter laminatus]|uniref:dTDP-3-amino-3,4,6-trideoxy-alpha-D-glucose transaminase n=1 Tax=Atribacter laminatus TaxID=2847778 RepID=A0A7T1AJX9_ATRLM|nr:DegT/DnrJ/EryC1/StrS family aminotransferase [Atribacter laminatus]QPM67302.1 dTDP-3-amino-3,4,6-trideoxy-alpha-D-glucose transaminase [Atribacter laminatus]